MKSSAKKVELASVDDLFSTEESRADAQRERVLEIPLSELHPFKNHPFKVKDDEAMLETADSIRQYGVLVPAIARPDPEGGYELVAGHRRHRASELAEKETMPVIVRDLDDDAATIIMVDSNLQRESLLPSERAFAYMRDISARELKGHNILAVERFQDNTSRMIEFSVLRSCAYGSPGDEMRLFLTEDGYQAALLIQQHREIKIKRYARVIEGHILDFKPDKRRRHS